MDVDVEYKGDKSTPLFIATQQDHKNIVKYLLSKGADINHSILPNNISCFFKACTSGNTYIVNLMLETGLVDLKLETVQNLNVLQLVCSVGEVKLNPVLEILLEQKEVVETINDVFFECSFLLLSFLYIFLIIFK